MAPPPNEDEWSIAARHGHDAPRGTDDRPTIASSLALHTVRPTTTTNTGKVLIIGAGWYGCHAAATLTRLGVAFDMVDSSNSFMAGSSSRNQNRLHLGFHYPRAHKTRTECVTGYNKFMAAYAHLTVSVAANLYLVAKDSVIDYATYRGIFKHEGVPFREVAKSAQVGMPFAWKRDAYDGAMLTDERMIDCDAAAAHFEGELRGRMLPAYDPAGLTLTREGAAYKNARYPMALNCTYGQLGAPSDGAPGEPGAAFELSCSWVFRSRKPFDALFGFTVMDGPFFSVYPYKPAQRLYTLTHVAWTPLLTSPDIGTVNAAIGCPKTLALVDEHRRRALSDVTSTIPDFKADFEYRGHFLSVKCKPGLRADDRSLRVRADGGCVSFCGGKITGVFAMEAELVRLFSKKARPFIQ